MTEEKENCIFQQNYNVFGLDDKPCCYLYHKYCNEINDCYFKRCKRLEQENKELKVVKEQLKKWNDENLKRQDEMQKWIDLAEEQRKNYRSALEEINKIAEPRFVNGLNEEADQYNQYMDRIQNIINEVLK